MRESLEVPGGIKSNHARQYFYKRRETEQSEEYRRGDPQGQAHGKVYHGLVYSAMNVDGNKIGNPFKSSVLGKTVGYDALEKQIAFSKNQAQEKKQTTQTRNSITIVLQQTVNHKEFVEILKAKCIDTVFRETETGRIYGATFIDHNTACVLNGSRLGKEFSANALQEHFATAAPNVEYSQPTKAIQAAMPHDDSSQPNDFSDDNMGLFSFETHGTDIEEEAFARKMRKKKKYRKNRPL